MTKKIKKLLIANRGEIACRIIKTAKRLGITTVAIYSTADKHALHVALADEAYCVGPPPSQQSYLQQETIIALALQNKVDAIHPGYGFLAENAEFAEHCAAANLIFVGPPSAAIRIMGSKSLAKQQVEKYNVPIIPGYQGEDQSLTTLQNAAKKMGFPVLIKAVSGGGGKGMRLVTAGTEFAEALASAKREAQSSFGDDHVLLEKYLPESRHVEVQIVTDQHGNGVYLFDRDCSIQRRHQKIIEEAPAPNLSEQLRKTMGEAALNAAKSVAYEGAGTVEFLLTPNHDFYFMEMNTRLQVEHPVTEMITGVDLVEWQLRVAQGEVLPKQQRDIKIHGHAIEVRLCAEDPAHDYRPAIGTLNYFKLPAETVALRIDTGVRQGDQITPFYDSMIAKIISHGQNRKEACEILSTALSQTYIIGVTTNASLLARILQNQHFADAMLSTQFLDQHATLQKQATLPALILYVASLAELCERQMRAKELAVHSHDTYSPWFLHDGWRLNHYQHHHLHFWYQQKMFSLWVAPHEQNYQITYDDQSVLARAYWQAHHQLHVVIDGNSQDFTVIPYRKQWHIYHNGEHYVLDRNNPDNFDELALGGEHRLVAPMPGTVVSVLVAPDESVKENQKLLVIEAMKMEHSLYAPHDGIIKTITCKTGDTVNEGEQLIEFAH